MSPGRDGIRPRSLEAMLKGPFFRLTAVVRHASVMTQEGIGQKLGQKFSQLGRRAVFPLLQQMETGCGGVIHLSAFPSQSVLERFGTFADIMRAAEQTRGFGQAEIGKGRCQLSHAAVVGVQSLPL